MIDLNPFFLDLDCRTKDIFFHMLLELAFLFSEWGGLPSFIRFLFVTEDTDIGIKSFEVVSCSRRDTPSYREKVKKEIT